MTDRPDMPRIKGIRPRAHYRLEIQWMHGETSVVDMHKIIEAGGVFDPLRDTELFAAVRTGERGRYIEWRDPTNEANVLADFDADSLIRLSDQQRAVSDLGRLLKVVKDKIASTREPA
jgi:hypothetical protein